jgi:L-serine dehydratase
MESIREIYKIGNGPSSSHTMAPKKAATIFLQQNPDAASFRIHLYGSLALTGKGHLTDKAILDVFPSGKAEILWHPGHLLPMHTNGMTFEALGDDGKVIRDWTTYSIGGGDISDTGKRDQVVHIYPFSTMKEILDHCEANGLTFWEFVEQHESPDIRKYLSEVWKVMKETIARGLEGEGGFHGGLRLQRKARSFYMKARNFSRNISRRPLVYSFALAVSEENAAGGIVVTAPTCGSCGVLPAVLYMTKIQEKVPDTQIIRALETAGLVGALIKTNASVSGAEVGCQGEVGSASSMAAAAVAQLFGATPGQIEYAASIAMEHFLGLTCDPMLGLVQIPCIERNALGAAHALDAAFYACLTDGHHIVGFDKVIHVMRETGHDLPSIYKETAEGGLAVFGEK